MWFISLSGPIFSSAHDGFRRGGEGFATLVVLVLPFLSLPLPLLSLLTSPLSSNTINSNDFNFPGVSEQELLKNLIQETGIFVSITCVTRDAIASSLDFNKKLISQSLTESSKMQISEIINTRKRIVSNLVDCEEISSATPPKKLSDIPNQSI